MNDQEWADWHRTKVWPWMSEKQWQCALLLCDLFGGFHHMKLKSVKEWGCGICYNTHDNLATFDFNKLTKLVVLAHDRCIRAEICPSGPGLLKIVLHVRSREGSMSERHPTIEEAIAKFRPMKC